VAERKPFLLRIDARLYDDLRRWADDDLRSLNAQIEFLLRRAMDERSKGKSKADSPPSNTSGPKKKP
jgi:hypothetical protein